jgi:cell division protein FtsL
MGLQQRAFDYEYEYVGHSYPERAPAVKPIRREKKMVRKENRSVPAARYVIIILAVVLVNVLLVTRHNVVLQRGYELKRLSNELTAIHTENERLALTIGQLESLDRIEEIAVSRLGMTRTTQLRLVAFQPTQPADADQPEVASERRTPWFGRIAAAVRGDSARAEASGTQP